MRDRLHINGYGIISSIIYLTICCLFIIKYISRINSIAAFVCAALFCILFCFAMRGGINVMLKRISFPLLIAVTLLSGIAVPVLFPVGTFDIDRWDMIEVFWRDLLAGNYPYAACGMTSGNNPAQSPVYFLLCMPFYLTRWYVGIPLAGILIWWWAANDRKLRGGFLQGALLLCSPFMLYEIFTCSSIFFNSALVYAWMTFLRKENEQNMAFMILHGVAGGLLLCTRNCYIIPVIIAGMYMLVHQKNKAQVVIWGLSAFTAFLAAYAPFVLAWGIEAWRDVNPFIVQTEMILSLPVIIFLVTGAVASGILCRNQRQAVLLSGVWLFVAPSLVMIENSINCGFYQSFFDSRTDVTYFILSVPFIMGFIGSGNIMNSTLHNDKE